MKGKRGGEEGELSDLEQERQAFFQTSLMTFHSMFTFSKITTKTKSYLLFGKAEPVKKQNQ